MARIDVVATVPGVDELQWLDMTIRRPTAVANVEGAARFGGFAATEEETDKKEKIWEQKRDWPGHGEAGELRVGRKVTSAG